MHLREKRGTFRQVRVRFQYGMRRSADVATPFFALRACLNFAREWRGSRSNLVDTRAVPRSGGSSVSRQHLMLLQRRKAVRQADHMFAAKAGRNARHGPKMVRSQRLTRMHEQVIKADRLIYELFDTCAQFGVQASRAHHVCPGDCKPRALFKKIGVARECNRREVF